MWVTATIHDFDAMDQAILNAPSPNDITQLQRARMAQNLRTFPQRPAWPPSLRPDAVNLAGSWQPAATVATAVSKVAAEEADRDARRATRSSEADTYFARGQQAEADGKPNVAKIYYQMAARRATGELKQQVWPGWTQSTAVRRQSPETHPDSHRASAERDRAADLALPPVTAGATFTPTANASRG